MVLERTTGRTDAAGNAGKPHVTLALLKPDGSWKECNFLSMELGFSEENPHTWFSWLGDSQADVNNSV